MDGRTDVSIICDVKLSDAIIVPNETSLQCSYQEKGLHTSDNTLMFLRIILRSIKVLYSYKHLCIAADYKFWALTTFADQMMTMQMIRFQKKRQSSLISLKPTGTREIHR